MLQEKVRDQKPAMGQFVSLSPQQILISIIKAYGIPHKRI
jgi:hypothetical protein